MGVPGCASNSIAMEPLVLPTFPVRGSTGLSTAEMASQFLQFAQKPRCCKSSERPAENIGNLRNGWNALSHRWAGCLSTASLCVKGVRMIAVTIGTGEYYSKLAHYAARTLGKMTGLKTV